MNEEEKIEKLFENEDVVVKMQEDNGNNYFAVEKNLLPCPFCGGRAYVCTHADVLFQKYWYSIRCFDCDADTSWYHYCKTAEESADKWNKRVR